MAKFKARVKVPKKAEKGEIVTVKCLATHPMHSGRTEDKDGKIIPRKILNKFTCSFNGEMVFGCDLGTGISKNPFLVFSAKVEESGEFHFEWVEDGGEVYEKTAKITVS